MTNETTASQPNSIGHDAQFQAMTAFMLRSEYDALVKLIDSRSPAAQASATIQAAPETCTGCDNPAGPQTADSHGFCKDCMEFSGSTLAATIQEPVMVAEPVGEFAAEVYTAMRCFDGTWGQGSNEMRRSALEAEASRLMRAPKIAAPMVADPAGVVVAEIGDPLLLNKDAFISPLCYRLYQSEISSYRKAMEIAATVKAVPSEALDRDWTEDFQHENGNYMNKCSACNQTFMGYKRHVTCRACAAPLAYKTGGAQ